MVEELRGCHHCIGAAFTVTNLVFNFIHSKAIANDGLSPQEILELRSRFLESYSSGFDYFENIHRECMEASRDAKSDPFARDMILASLLSACENRSAKHVFSRQIGVCGSDWLDDFFYALASYVRDHVYREAEPRLIAAFVDAAGKYKSRLSVSHLLQEPNSQDVIKKCVNVFQDEAKRELEATRVCATVNEHIAKQRIATDPNVVTTKKDEILRFMVMLPNEIALAIKTEQ